jgi:MFS family permease
MAFVVFLDGTIVSISLPRIASTLKLGNRYVWVTNSFWLAGTVIQPLCAQISDVIGRKKPMLTSVVGFFVGGAICGCANNAKTLIIGRTLQGLGGGGIMLLMEIILCDIVSMRERSSYLGILLSVAAFGAIVGPPLGGIIAERSWRWIFFLNLPISFAAFMVMALFMRLRYNKPDNWTVAMAQIDWTGTVLILGALTSLLVGLVLGSSGLPWSSPTVIITTTVGGLGWACFHIYEMSTYCTNPAIPPHLFRNRTSVAGFAITLIISIFTTGFAFCWPTYFQGVLLMSPTKAGLNYLVYSTFLIPSAIISGYFVTKTGLYQLSQLVGLCILALGCGLNLMLTQDTRPPVRIVFISLNALGLGSVIPSVLPTVLAALPEADVAKATGMYSLLRSFGYIWGATLPPILFNLSSSNHLYLINDPHVRDILDKGNAYQYISEEFLQSLPGPIRDKVVDVYARSLRLTWKVGIALAVIGLLTALCERRLTMRTSTETEYGLDTLQVESLERK